MTEQPDAPDFSGVPPTPPPAGPSPYPYAYPPGAPGAPGPQGFPPGAYPGGYPPPPPPMPYGDYYPGAPVAPPRNGLGVAALVLAILGLLASCSVAGGIVLGISAVILGVMARNRVKRGEANNGGVALAGIILGALAVLISVAFISLFYGVFNNYGGREMLSCVQDAGSDNDRVQQCMEEFQQRIEDAQGQVSTPG